MVEWKKIALKQFEQAYNYIKSDSAQNAEKVKVEILKFIETLSHHPQRRPLDKYKNNNDGTFRYFMMFNLRVHYRVVSNGILILQVRHTKRKPFYH